MDAQPTDQPGHDNKESPRRGRRLVTALLVAGALAAVPAGVALAESADGGAGSSAGGGTVPAQSTTPDEGQQGRGDGDRRDCPEKDGQGRQGSTQL